MRAKEILNELIDLGFVADDSQKAAEGAIEDAIAGKDNLGFRLVRSFYDIQKYF
jgi:hypothetical protein